MKRNPFKKQSIIDTLTNVGIGGASNVAIDYIWKEAGLDKTFRSEDTAKTEAEKDAGVANIKNLIKITGGVLVGSMVSNKYARLAADGVATVGVSNLISDMMTEKEEEEKDPSDSANTSGLPHGTIGRLRYGAPALRNRAARNGRMAGLNDFMGE